jgi:hypothetical protein
MEHKLTKRATQAWLIMLALLMAVTGVAVLGVMGKDLYTRLFNPPHDLPKILILTDDIVQAGVEGSAALDSEGGSLSEDFIHRISSQTSQTKGSDKSGLQVLADDNKSNPKPISPYAQQGQNLNTLKKAMADGIAFSLSDQLQQSHLFNAIPIPQIATAMVDLRAAAPSVQQKSPGSSMSNASVKAQQEADQQKKDEADGKIKFAPGIENMATKLGADFIINVSVNKPDTDIRILRGDLTDTSLHIEISSKPIITVEVYKLDGSAVPEAFIITGKRNSRNVDIKLPIIDINLKSDFQDASQNLAVAVNKDIATQIVRELLDRYAPPSIAYRSDSGSYAIDRGEDGNVKVGAVYDVIRDVGDEVVGAGADGSQRSLGHDHMRVGSIRISRVDKLKAYAIAADGGPFNKGDRVYPVKAGSGGSSSSGGASDQAGAMPSSHRLAIYPLVLDAGGKRVQSAELTEAVEDSLARDPRVQVIARTDTMAVVDERKLNDKMSGDHPDGDNDPAVGMAQSDYMITGEFSGHSQTSHKTSSYWGVVQSHGSVTTTTVTGRISATTTDGGIRRYSVEASGATPKAAASDGVAKLLAQMFPSVPAPQPAGALSPASSAPAGPAPPIAARHAAKAHASSAKHHNVQSEPPGGLQF